MEGSHHGASLEVPGITSLLLPELIKLDLVEASDSELSIFAACVNEKPLPAGTAIAILASVR